jgi:chloramphenicol-sensitive protein RarD
MCIGQQEHVRKRSRLAIQKARPLVILIVVVAPDPLTIKATIMIVRGCALFAARASLRGVSAIPDETPAKPSETASPGSRVGLLYGFGAYLSWGFVPLYFHAISTVSPWVILCHRVVWAGLFLALIVSARQEWSFIWPVVRRPRCLLQLALGAILIAINWLVFIYSVNTNQVLQASLGYFINPLFSIALGVIFLRERLRGWQWLAVAIAAAAVANLALRGDRFPWISISLAASFGFYGLVRKKIDINSLHGLLVETAILLPLSAAFLACSPAARTSSSTLALLSLSGIVTAVPLLMFGAAVRRLPLSTMGFLQYIGPTLQFLVAIGLFHEALDRAKLASFVLCWIGIAVYVLDSILTRTPCPIADKPE